MRKTIFIILLLILMLNLVSANYITGEIILYENGLTKLNIQTDSQINIDNILFENNKLTGKTNSLTSKKGNIWTFELDLESYDEILLDIQLPKNLDAITSIEGPDSIIDIENKIITIIDSGELNFKLSYKLKETQSFAWLFWPILFIIITISYFIFKKTRKRKERLDHILPLINDNEKKIIDILMKGPMRQKNLRKTLGIPKASFTRYILNLEKKKLILREGEGKNKVVKLK